MVGCLYISEFPAWAQLLQRPRSRAVAVYHGGRIIARSRFLRQLGMLLGDSLDRAQTLFPEASYFDRDAPFEQASWEGVLRQINEITPRLEPLEQGVAFFKPYDISETRLLAERLNAQVGLAPNKSVARIAAVRSAPGAILQIRDDAAGRFLSQTNVSVLVELGFDEELSSRLELFGLTSLDRVGELSRRHLRVQFGDSGLRLFSLLHPSSEATRVSAYIPSPAITEAYAFDLAASELPPLPALLDAMVHRAVLRLDRFFCSRIMLRLEPAGNAPSSRLLLRILKSPTADPGVIGRAAAYLLQAALSVPFRPSSIALTLTGLETPSRAQGSFFFERPPIDTVIKRLNRRFPGAIRRPLVVHPGAPFPEDRVRFIPFSEA